MSSHDEPPASKLSPRLQRVFRAVRRRIAIFAVLALLALLAWGDFGWLRGILPRPDEPANPAASPAEQSVGWPHRRGPGYNALSMETGLADSWPPEGPPVLWAREIGRGYSGFTLLGDRAFTQTQSLTGQHVLCLAADTGEPIWQHRYDWPYEPAGMYPGPRATPTLSGQRVFFAGPNGLVGCLDAYDGNPVWQVNVDEKFSGRGTGFGYSCSPLVENGKVFLPVGGSGASVVALDARDGATVWTSGDEPASYCSALPITFQGRRCVVAFLQNVLVLLDIPTGRQLCLDVQSSGYDEHAAAPLYEEPYLVVARPFRAGAVCYRLVPDDSAADDNGLPGVSLETVWQSRELSNDTASSVLIDGHVYGFDLRDVQAKIQRPSRGSLKCLGLETGDVCWSTDQVGHSTVIVADGKLILFTDEGELILARADPSRYEELARTRIFDGEICWTAPALDRGRLYVRSPTRAACVYLGQPERLEADLRRAARPAEEIPRSSRVDLTLFVGGEREYAFDPADAEELWRWFSFSVLGALGVSAILSAAARLLVRSKWPLAAARAGQAVFWTAAFTVGVLGTPIFNRWTGTFVFTWPVCLFVAHQTTLNVIVGAGDRPDSKQRPWLSLMAACWFMAVCLVYFLACRRLSLATEWAFLIGFLPSWPIAVPAALRFKQSDRPIRNLIWALLSFSAFFWAAGGYLIWRGGGP